LTGYLKRSLPIWGISIIIQYGAYLSETPGPLILHLLHNSHYKQTKLTNYELCTSATFWSLLYGLRYYDIHHMISSHTQSTNYISIIRQVNYCC